MHPCPSCAELVTSGTCVCPHCGEKACTRSGVHGTALLLGLTLALGAGCPTPQPKYGVPTTTDTASTQTGAASVAPSEETGVNTRD